MSTEQSVDPELVEQTKQQIRNLVREIAQLSRSEVSPLEFYDAMLNRVVSALAAVGGAIWTLADTGRLELEYQINLQDTGLAGNEEAQIRHGQLLRKVVNSGQGLLVAPHSGAGEEEEGGNPTDYLLVLGPLKADQEAQGVLEVFQRPGAGINVQRGYLRFLLQMCELASDFLKSRKLRNFSDRQTLWSQLENFTRAAHRSLDPTLTAYTIANEGRRLIECDRVCVAISKGRKCVIQAVSGQDTFDRRSNTVSMLSRLATAVVATGETMWYTGDTTNMAPQVEDAVQAYVDEAHSKTVGVIPLEKPRDTTDDDKSPPEVIGALIVEQIEDSRPKEGLLQRVEVVRDHSSSALSNALEHHNLFLMPLWRALGRAKWVLRARTLPKTLAVVAALVGVTLFLVLWRTDFELEGKGVLQPATMQNVFAGIDGLVTDVYVKHGDMVKRGQLLAQMKATDLDGTITDITGQRTATEEQMASTRRLLLEPAKLTPEERNRLNGDYHRLLKTFESLSRQLDLLTEKKKRLDIRSPIDGKVVTWKVEEMIGRRPVQEGQILMTVADPSREWELEIHMPENRMGHIAQALAKVPEGKLKVTYFVATDPGNEHAGHVIDIDSNAEVRPDEGNTVLIRVAIDERDVQESQLGLGVTAKVYCGRASIGYVWLHDLIGFVQSKILFRL